MIRRISTISLALGTLLIVAVAVCQAEPRPLLTRHTRDVVVHGQAAIVGHMPANQTMRLVLTLPLRNEADLDRFLEDVQDPSSDSYHQFLSVEEFTAKYGPTKVDYEAVKDFARANGFEVVKNSSNRLNVDVRGSVENIEKAFHVSMNIYQHPTEARTFYAPDREPTTETTTQLWHISGLDNYSIPRTNLKQRPAGLAKSNATTGSCPGASFCGSDMRAAYYGGTKLTGSGQYLGLLEYAGTDLADLTTYFKNAKQTNNVPITLLSTDGTSTSCTIAEGCDDTEQTIDMTQAIGMAPGLAGLTEYVGSTDSAIFNSMATDKPLKANLSSSWYWFPADPSTDDPYFKEFHAQGQNLFDAAGDGGDWQISGSIWPSDDAYVTGVGGTDLETASAGGAWKSETVWVDGGGGISPNNIPIPAWQKATAAKCSECSQTLRNGPDVTANANFTFYVCADQSACSENLYGGTSFAAPMWAGWLALLNQQEVAAGHKTLGFINPAIYTVGLGASYSKDFHDITVGSNGYSAEVGFDLASGWGSMKAGGIIK